MSLTVVLLARNQGRSGRCSLLCCQSWLLMTAIVLGNQTLSIFHLKKKKKDGSVKLFVSSLRKTVLRIQQIIPVINLNISTQPFALCLCHQHSLCIKSFYNLNTIPTSMYLTVSLIHQSITYFSSQSIIIKFQYYYISAGSSPYCLQEWEGDKKLFI